MTTLKHLSGKLWALLFSLLTGCYAWGQIPQAPQALPGPNTAGLGVYGDVPVSLFTGIPQIEIPLYELKEGEHTLPLSLSYYAGGVRPDQHPGWVGLNWSLNAGGVITRVIKDMPDEYNNSYFVHGKESGYYFTHELLNTANWSSKDYLVQVAQHPEIYVNDTEPDVFSFSFLDYSGKFMLTHDGQWKVQCDKPVKVEFDNTFLAIPSDVNMGYVPVHGNFKSFGGFTLTAEDGTQYVFGGTTSAIEYSVAFFAQTRDEWKAVSWYLTKIVYPDGDEITFKYSRDELTCQMYISVYQDIFTMLEDGGTCYSYSFNNNIEDFYNGQLIAPIYLDEIKSRNTTIQFERNSNPSELQYSREHFRRKTEAGAVYPYLATGTGTGDYLGDCLDNLGWSYLNGIWIYASDGMKTYQLKYNQNTSERLMLESIEEYNYGTSAYESRYRFSYNQPEKLPGYLSNKTDHWGFFNNREAPLNSLEEYQTNRNTTVVPAYALYGMLEKIEYPTGGYTRLVFEQNDCSKIVKLNRWEGCDTTDNGNQVTGGVRIKKIIESRTGLAEDEVVDKEYFYINDYLETHGNHGTSSGVQGGQVQYSFSSFEVEDIHGGNFKYWKNIFSSQSLLPGCDNIQGSHIGYSEVIERRADGSFTRYQFSNFDNGHLDEAPAAVLQPGRSPYEPYSSTAVERGRLIRQEEYTKDDVLKKRTTFSYERSDMTSNNHVRCMKVASYYACDSDKNKIYGLGATYRIYTYSYRKAQERVTVYDDPANPIETVIDYTYNADGLLKSKRVSVNQGSKIYSYKYPADYSTAVYKNMKAKHVLSPVVEETVEQKEGNATYPISHIRHTYTALTGGTDRYFGVKQTEQSFGNGPMRARVYCHKFDAKGNAVHLTINEEDVVYLWGYDYQCIVAEIRNATWEAVESIIGSINDFSAADKPDLKKLAMLRKFLKDASMTTYTHAPGLGITSITDACGKTTYYQYDDSGRLIYERNSRGKVVKTYDYHYSIK